MTTPLNLVYNKYNKELKPLVSEIEGRLEKFEEPLLMNLMAQFDYVALSILEDDSNKQRLYLQQALSHLDIAVTNSYQYLVYALAKKNNIFKKRCGGEKGIAKLSDGKYIGKYKSLDKKGKANVRKGLTMEVCDAGVYFKEAYECYIEQETILEKLAIVSITRKKSFKSCIIIRGLFSIIISIIAGCIVNTWLNGML